LNSAQVVDRVRLAVMPPWVASMPQDTQDVFVQCLGNVFTIREIRDRSDGHRDFELWVQPGRDRRRSIHADIIWVEPEYLEVVTGEHIIGSLSTWLSQAGSRLRRAR
jgi:hypothetical protein